MKKIADINKNVRKKGFSLIEILQTVILVGIIAGLSVSFFKKVNTDDKLMMSTTAMLRSAIEEANLQMCADETPYCNFGGGGFSPLSNGETATAACRRYYGNNDIYFDSALGYCVKQHNINDADDIAPTLKLQNIANLEVVNEANHIYKYNYTYYTDDKDKDGKPVRTKHTQEIYIKIDGNSTLYCNDADCNVPSNTIPAEDGTELSATNITDFRYLQMDTTKDRQNHDIFFAPLPCVNPDTLEYTGESRPLHDTTCQDNVPVWDAKIRRTDDCFNGICPNDGRSNFWVSEICYRLWDIINHKEQIVGNNSDLYMTCVESNPCINTGEGSNCDGSDVRRSTNKANMILPNGARLYNLSCLANTSCIAATDNENPINVDHQNIFIKADRIADDRTFNFTTQSTSVINALQWFNNNIKDHLTEADFADYNRTVISNQGKGAGNFYNPGDAGLYSNEYVRDLFKVDKDGAPK